MDDGFTRRDMCRTGLAMVLAAQAMPGLAQRRTPPAFTPAAEDWRFSSGTDKGEWRTYSGDLRSTLFPAGPDRREQFLQAGDRLALPAGQSRPRAGPQSSRRRR